MSLHLLPTILQSSLRLTASITRTGIGLYNIVNSNGFFEHVFTAFTLFLKNDPAFLNELTRHHFVYDQVEWQFQLPQLHAFLQSRHREFESISYKKFRQQLFNCPINHALSRYTAEITILENRHNVDSSTYVLRPLPTCP